MPAADDAVPNLDPLIHQPHRLRILTLLFRNRYLSYTEVRDRLGLTDGNLGSHAKRLEDAGLLRARRILAGTSFQVRYVITDEGRTAFRAYLRALRVVLDETAEGSDPASSIRVPAAKGSSSREAT